MPLHIDPEARAAFAPFYDFALAQTPPPSAVLFADCAGAQGTAGDAPAQECESTCPQAAQAADGASGIATPTAVLTLAGVDDAALAAHVGALSPQEQTAIACVIVKDSPALESLAPLAALTHLACVGVWGCPKLRTLWAMEGQPLWGLALTDCKSLPNLAPLAACADTLCHLFLQGRAWNTPRFQTLDPLPRLHALVTCDLALRKAAHSGKIYFDECFPKLAALTVTPNLAKFFRRVKD